MGKPTFEMALRDGSRVKQAYAPLMFTVGDTTHRLAVSRVDRISEWIVSDPRSGAKICTVYGEHKGVPCSSRGLTEREALELAKAELEALINRIGSERFNAVLADPKPF